MDNEPQEQFDEQKATRSVNESMQAYLHEQLKAGRGEPTSEPLPSCIDCLGNGVDKRGTYKYCACRYRDLRVSSGGELE